MSTTTISHPSFSIPFTQLVQRLRYTNARYNQIAHQCRRTQRPTHHAKRRAYRAGLRIDTSKTRVAWPGEIASAASIQFVPVLDGTAGSPVWMDTEAETEIEIEEEEEEDSSAEEGPCTPRQGLPLRNCVSEVIAEMQPVTLCQLSPLLLGFGSNVDVDDSDACDLPLPGRGPVPVPGAPRWRSIPLPDLEDECGSIEAMRFAMSESVSCTHDPSVWRGTVMATHVSDSVSTPVDVVYPGLGITVPPKWMGVPDDGYFQRAWRSEANRRWGGL